MERKKKILIVDDSRMWALQMMSTFDTLGFSYEWVKSGVDAVNRVMDKRRYHVIIMDFKMPRMGGVEATRKIRKLGYTGFILGYTSIYGNENTEEGLQAGMDRCLSKSLTLDPLVKLLREVGIE